MKGSVCVVLITLLIAGCAMPPVKLQTKFVGAEHDVYREPGTGVINGQGFLRQKGGGVVTCAGGIVRLSPATALFREIIGHWVNGRKILFEEKNDPVYNAIVKASRCDAGGNFTFANLPTGDWYVTTEVYWSVDGRRQGGKLLAKVTTTNGQSIQVLLTDSVVR